MHAGENVFLFCAALPSLIGSLTGANSNKTEPLILCVKQNDTKDKTTGSSVWLFNAVFVFRFSFWFICLFVFSIYILYIYKYNIYKK